MHTPPVEKVCPVCLTSFSVPPSLNRVTCCSRECSAKHRSRKKARTCPQCSKSFTTPPSSKQVYCSRECGQTSRRGRPHTNARKVDKVCPVCETAFTVPPSQNHVICCSQECSRIRLKGQPRNFTPESRAQLKGRPKKAADVERTCPICATTFTVPEYDRKAYCSIPCSYEARKGRRGPNRQIDKTCPVCDQPFSVPASLDRVVCCSTKCAGLLKRGAAAESVRQMTDVEAAFFAGLFEGEGSIILTQRSRPGGGTVKISIANTFIPLLERAQEIAGVGPIRVRPRENPVHLDAGTWETNGASAREILRQIRPWLISRAERADAVLAGESFPRQTRWDRVYPEVITPE